MLTALRSSISRIAKTPSTTRPALRAFGGYAGQSVEDHDLIKKHDDWVIEETNFCIGRFSSIRYKETDDLARRTKRLIEMQQCYMHTRLRDGTCIAHTGMTMLQCCDMPTPYHTFNESTLLKWTWDECYDEAFDDAPVPVSPAPQKK